MDFILFFIRYLVFIRFYIYTQNYQSFCLKTFHKTEGNTFQRPFFERFQISTWFYAAHIIPRWKSRTRGLGGDSHIDVSVLFFKPSSEQLIKLLNSFLQFFKQILLNCAQLVVLIVSRLYWSSVDRIDRQLIAARKTE